jgi:hypothetical protein
MLLLGKQDPAAMAVDAAVEAGDDRPAVLGDHQRLAFGEAADLFGSQDVDVVAGHGPAGHRAGLPTRPGDANGA